MSDNSLQKGRYTKFSNKIGLYSNTKHGFVNSSSDVVLNFPFKDAVLEGGMSKEDVGREERFLHFEMDRADIDTLEDPKVLTNFKLTDTKGEHTLTKDSDVKFFDSDGELKQNLLIKGNNLLALYTLREKLAGKVKLIYIDPPYNTGNDGFKYNDKFNRSAWLVFMKNRLEVARDLLSEDGSIYVQLDYNEVHYAKVLLDEVFGEQNFQREIIWDISVLSGYKTIANNWVRGHDTILYYSKNYEKVYFHKVRSEHSEKYLERFNKKEPETGRMYFDGRGTKLYLDEVIKKGKAVGDVWGDIMSFQQTATSKERLKDFTGQKPEKLLERIILSATEPGDIVLDFCLGTATTSAAAHKLNRRWVGIEQMDYIEDVAKERLKKVVGGEQGGISKSVEWQGGGSFVYLELKKYNQEFVDKINSAKTMGELDEVYNEMSKNAFLKFWFDKKAFEKDENFRSLDIAERKQKLIDVLDENQLYLNYLDMDDKKHRVAEDEKALTDKFYAQSN